jgi:undecaprenyl diphosphate synthase
MHLPNHVAVIMDGNGRWAKERFLPRTEGHRRGVATLRRIVEAARREGVKHLSVFAFSSENWNRPGDEVQTLMKFFVKALAQEAKPLLENGIRLHVVGDVAAFDGKLREAIAQAEQITAPASAMTLNVLMNYGGRWDIAQAARAAAAAGEPITEESIGKHLALSWAGPVDLMIRTGGEKRISNFILWQAAYAELWFSDVYWPQFGPEHLHEALEWYDGRERRFGKTSEQIQAVECENA